MTDADELLEVGRIAKAHGLNGEVNVVLTTTWRSRSCTPITTNWNYLKADDR